MSRFIWTPNRISELGMKFLKSVLDNMNTEDTKIRFGTTGQGIKPNYQVSYPEKEPITFSGRNHEKFSGSDRFEENNLSESFPYSTIQEAYVGAKPRS